MPNSYNKAIIIGDACVDVSFRLSDYLKNDEKEMPYTTSIGGTCAGTCVPLANLGVETAFMGTIGLDYGGKFILDGFKKKNIDTSLVNINKDLNTVNVYGLIEDNGERHLWAFPRQDVSYTDLSFTQKDIEKIQTASWLHASGMSLLFDSGNIKDNLPKLYEIAYKAGVPTSFDLNTRVADITLLKKDAVEAIYKIIPYVKYLTGSAKDEFVSFYPSNDWKESARYFADNGRIVIARLAQDGSYIIKDGQEKHIKSFNVEPINTTGAGDTFNAGFIAAMLKGFDEFEAVKYANAAAAFKISRVNGQELLNDESLNRFMLEATN